MKLTKKEKLRRHKLTKGFLKKELKKKLKAEEKNKEDEWKRKVFERDKDTCQICGKIVEGHNKHPHHIIPRGFEPTRWDLMNGICLCYRHHKVGINSPHMNAIWFSEWLKLNKLEQYNYLLKYIKTGERITQ